MKGKIMRCTRMIDEDIVWVGADNRRPTLFEAVYPVPHGMSYNSYLILDDKVTLIDTVDRAVTDVFIENLEKTLDGRAIDYLVIQHMEPDHSATLFDVLLRYPDCTVVCNKKTYDMITAFKNRNVKAHLVNDSDTLCLGKHTLSFIFAPMVHWPEVMVSYDMTTGTLFSADAFGSFGALGGAIFADEVDFDRDHIDEARRYYSNIVGKYGMQVKSLLNKASNLDIKKICPLHGYVWRENIAYYVNKYLLWSAYEPEERGVMIAYASVYGNTENVANALACRLYEKGIKASLYDVSATDPSYIVADAFKFSHLVFASVTYNGGAFVLMENLLCDLSSHGIRDRKVALIENGSWAPSAAKRMRQILEPLKGIEFIGNDISFRSAMHSDTDGSIDKLADMIASTL
jgi:flavorubredoxin